jgi:hypothetical protein
MSIIRTIIGFREKDGGDDAAFYLAPTIPDRLMKEGRRYAIRNLRYHGMTFDVHCTCAAGGELAISLAYRAETPSAIVVVDEQGSTTARSTGSTLAGRTEFKGPNGRVYQVSIKH